MPTSCQTYWPQPSLHHSPITASLDLDGTLRTKPEPESVHSDYSKAVLLLSLSWSRLDSLLTLLHVTPAARPEDPPLRDEFA